MTSMQETHENIQVTTKWFIKGKTILMFIYYFLVYKYNLE